MEGRAPAAARQSPEIGGGSTARQQMTDITHRTIEVSGHRIHIAEAGGGPVVILCHGFPES